MILNISVLTVLHDEVSKKYCTRIKDGEWSVYTFDTKELAMEFIRTPEHIGAMKNVNRFYRSFEVKRNF